MSAQSWSAATTLGLVHQMYIPTLKGFAARGTLSGLTGIFVHSIPGLSLRSNPRLKLANAFGVVAPNSN